MFYLGGRVDVAVGNNRDVGVGSLCHRLKKDNILLTFIRDRLRRQILNILTGTVKQLPLI
jgi:hypothetical protein